MARFAPYMLVAILGVLVSSLLTPPRRDQAEFSAVARDTGVRALGAARGYASVALWLRAGDAYKRGDLYETTATYQLIRELQPRNPAVYSYLAWNEAYNISAQFPEPERRMEWVARGFETLRQGQRALPRDASLRLDEWHFVLNRSIGQPVGVLQTELPAWGKSDPQWELIAKTAIDRHAQLGATDQAALRLFLDEIGLQADLFKIMDQPEPDRTALERRQAAALLALSDDARGVLVLCHWCRFHLMTLVLQPALAVAFRPLSLDLALLNSYAYAGAYMLPQTESEFGPRYRQGVATALKAGIDNAARYGGESAKAEFLAHVRENFELAGVPELLPE